ncbi:uncharacterized protein LOC122056295 [Zingiber officinale]|uniref:uncharacterized protein LOC122056295 n=1 Tax=Zingiber officinale TaxID=94328 RepID=UPI001C4BE17B|nr:uncharacterized protein LOC122056295 [Zingiber officinale]
MKTKRKDLDEACDEFMEFSLSSPARKIRRLDPDEFSPIVEEVETASAMEFDDSVSSVSGDDFLPSSESLHKADSPPYPSNDERAIVLYKPVESPIFLSPGSSNLSVRVTSDLIHALKNQVFKPGNQRFQAKDETEAANSSSLALVPWAPSQAAMATEEAEATSMEVEEEVRQVTGYGAGGEGLQQLPQHCMITQVLPNTSNPIMWSW